MMQDMGSAIGLSFVVPVAGSLLRAAVGLENDWLPAAAIGAIVAVLIASTANIVAILVNSRRADIRQERLLVNNDQRATADRASMEATRDAVDRREREANRHGWFTTAVEQLSSDKPAVRMGALYALSALADEWDEEARRRLVQEKGRSVRDAEAA